MSIKKLLYLIFLSLISLQISAKQASNKKLRFAFMTDIHLNIQDDGDRYNGLQQALKKVKEMNVDFIIIGGDVVDISGASKELSIKEVEDFYDLYKKTFDDTKIPYYPTIGNHDRFFDADNGYIEGDEIFKKYFKDSFYTFENKGIHFFVINSVRNTPQGDLYVDKEQLEWLKAELAKVSSSTPIILSTHVPIYSLYYPVVENRYVSLDVVGNYKELLNTFNGYNLKLVLQGHQHLHEEILLQGVQYITGGAVCAAWWKGAFHGTEEGFLIVDIDNNNELSWEYIDYGWTPAL